MSRTRTRSKRVRADDGDSTSSSSCPTASGSFPGGTLPQPRDPQQITRGERSGFIGGPGRAADVSSMVRNFQEEKLPTSLPFPDASVELCQTFHDRRARGAQVAGDTQEDAVDRTTSPPTTKDCSQVVSGRYVASLRRSRRQSLPLNPPSSVDRTRLTWPSPRPVSCLPLSVLRVARPRLLRLSHVGVHLPAFRYTRLFSCLIDVRQTGRYSSHAIFQAAPLRGAPPPHSRHRAWMPGGTLCRTR